jgi:uncharacterized protein with HEPN domain
MTPEALKLLEDMREAADDVASFTADKSVDDYRADKQLRRAVERSFEIIGEALYSCGSSNHCSPIALASPGRSLDSGTS